MQKFTIWCKMRNELKTLKDANQTQQAVRILFLKIIGNSEFSKIYKFKSCPRNRNVQAKKIYFHSTPLW